MLNFILTFRKVEDLSTAPNFIGYYDYEQAHQDDIEMAKQTGYEQGIEPGIEQGIEQMVINMKVNGLSIEEI